MVSFQIPGAIHEAESGASTTPLIVLFERDDGVAVPLLSQLRLAGYDVRASRTPVELFDTLSKQLTNLVLVDLGNATAGRREFWVALDTQRRGKAIQVMTFRYVQPGSIFDVDFDTSAKALADIEVHGAHEFQLLVEGVRQRVPLHGAGGFSAQPAPLGAQPAPLGAHPALPGGIAPIGAALGVPSPYMPSGDLGGGMPPPQYPGGFANPYGNGFDPTAALSRGNPSAPGWQDPRQAFQPAYPQPGFMAPGAYSADPQQPALQSGWMDPRIAQQAQPPFPGFDSPFANPVQANPYGAEQSPFAQPYSMNPFADPAFGGSDSLPGSDPFGGAGSISSIPSDPWGSSFSSAATPPPPFSPFGEQQPHFYGSENAPGSVAAFARHAPQSPFTPNSMFAPPIDHPATLQRQPEPAFTDAWIPPEADLDGETGVVPEMAYRPIAGRAELTHDSWREPVAPYDLPTAGPAHNEEEITARIPIPTPNRLPAVRPPTQTEKALSNVLVEGALLSEQRLDALKGIQQMLSSVDMNFKLGELALLFKFLSPDQLLAALLVSRGLVSPQQIAGLGRVKQELSGSGMDYDLETLLTMFHILPAEQLRALRAELG